MYMASPRSAACVASMQQARAAEDVENQPGMVAGQRGVQVTGSAELSATPDCARVCFRLVSVKGTAAEAKSSVQKRLDYINQSLRQTGITEQNITKTEEFQRTSNAYQMDTEVCVIFKDFEKMQDICNLLVEKLDNSVTISSPHFYHSPECLEKLRCGVCLNAVSNARRKAQEVCRLTGQSLGRAIVIREEEMREWEDRTETNCISPSLQHKIKTATVYVAAKVFVAFEMKTKERNKKNL